MTAQAACTIDNNAYQIVSLTQMILPLILATVVSVIFVWYLWKSVSLPLASHSLGLLDLTRIIRFGALLGIIVLSAILYAFVMGTWAREHIRPGDPMPARTVFMVSMVWECEFPRYFDFNSGLHARMISRNPHPLFCDLWSPRGGLYNLAFLVPSLLQTYKENFPPSPVIV